MKLPPVVNFHWEDGAGRVHAVIHPAKGASPAIALDFDGYEYAVGCGIRQKPAGGIEWWDNGRLTHVASTNVAPKWEPLAGVGETPNHDVDADAIRKWHGAPALVKMREWVDLVREWHNKPRRGPAPTWLVLHGPTGCGKTSAARFIQREFAGMAIHAPFYPWRAIVEKGLAARKDSGVMPHYADAVMIVDDIGADNASAFAAELLYTLTDAAEQDGRVLVVTSNLTPTELLAMYRANGDSTNANAERAVDRINRRSRVVALTARRK